MLDGKLNKRVSNDGFETPCKVAMNSFELIHFVIRERITAEGAFYYPDPWWEKELGAICEDMQAARIFIENDCSDEELFWLSEIFEDIIDRTGDVAFLGCLRTRAERMTDEARRKEVLDEIQDAERRFIPQDE